MTENEKFGGMQKESDFQRQKIDKSAQQECTDVYMLLLNVSLVLGSLETW